MYQGGILFSRFLGLSPALPFPTLGCPEQSTCGGGKTDSSGPEPGPMTGSPGSTADTTGPRGSPCSCLGPSPQHPSVPLGWFFSWGEEGFQDEFPRRGSYKQEASFRHAWWYPCSLWMDSARCGDSPEPAGVSGPWFPPSRTRWRTSLQQAACFTYRYPQLSAPQQVIPISTHTGSNDPTIKKQKKGRLGGSVS